MTVVPDVAPTTLLDTALAYAARGWHVLPCAPHDKTPITAHGLKDATTDSAQIRAWWARTPDANVAIATGAASGVVAIDIDGPDGEQSLELLEAVHGALPGTVRAITGGDGWHHIYAHPGGELRNTAGRLGAGIDTRGDGGYIVVPPSLHPSGRTYEWVDGPDDVPLGELPGWVLEALSARAAPPGLHAPRPVRADTTTPYAAKVLDERVREVAGAAEGTRNDTLNRAAFRMGQLVAGGQIPEQSVTELLTAAGGRVGLDDREISRTLRSGLDDGAKDPQYPDPARASGRAPNLTVVKERADGDTSTGHTADALVDGFRGTDSGNADRFVAASAGHARYVHAWGRWIVYDETVGVWQVDLGDALVTELAKQVARAMFVQAAELTGSARDALWKWAKRCEAATAISNMIRLARGTNGVLVKHTELDAQPWLLNVVNGTIDLRDGTLRAHDPDDLLTVQAPTLYEPDAEAPLWAACLERWQPDPTMRHYLQQIIGTGATGHPVEHLFINLGPGGNGKGKFYGAVAHVLGDYVVIPHKSLITVQRHEQHDTIKARLFGARLAIASETDANDRLDEAKVKDLTGGDLLEARRMREDPWKFRPTHTMVMHTNHRPSIRGVDEGVWRRIRLIPWDVTIPLAEQDTQLAEKLNAESSGILNWIVAGATAWRETGFHEPASVAQATAGYRSSQDTLAGFLEENFELAASHRVAMKDIVDTYERWCEATGETPVSKNAFGRMLTDRGFALTHDRRYRVGLRLADAQAKIDPEPPECPGCGHTATSPGHEGWYCDRCKSVFPDDARNVTITQIPTHARAGRGERGDARNARIHENDNSLLLPGEGDPWKETW